MTMSTACDKFTPDNVEVENDPGGLASSGLADRGAAWLAKGWLAARKEV